LHFVLESSIQRRSKKRINARTSVLFEEGVKARLLKMFVAGERFGELFLPRIGESRSHFFGSPPT
jgi:hypothetical protein